MEKTGLRRARETLQGQKCPFQHSCFRFDKNHTCHTYFWESQTHQCWGLWFPSVGVDARSFAEGGLQEPLTHSHQGVSVTHLRRFPKKQQRKSLSSSIPLSSGRRRDYAGNPGRFALHCKVLGWSTQAQEPSTNWSASGPAVWMEEWGACGAEGTW